MGLNSSSSERDVSATGTDARRSTSLMPLRPKSLLALIMAASSLAASAAEPSNPSAKLEVEQLLARIAASGCQFQRNGIWHSAADARAHLEKKYRYLVSKHLLKTSDDFISLAASKSSTSGKPYFVKCGTQQPVRSATWMSAQLREVRAAKPRAPAKSN